MKILSCYWQVDDSVNAWPGSVSEQVIPSLLRRRLTNLGKMAFQGLYSVRSMAGDEALAWVIACRHGDTARMSRLLTELADDETLSPTDFSLSVHNAIAAQFAIATGNKKMQIALSGGEKSFELGLLEAYALQKETGENVGYIYYDQPLPVPYHLEPDVPAVCIAMILSEATDCLDGIDLSYCLLSESTQSGFYPFIDFMNNQTSTLNLAVAGGSFLMERSHG